MPLGPQSVGCPLEQFRCDKAIEIPDLLYQISKLQPGQRLVVPLKPTLVRKDRPIAEFCFGGYSNFGKCDHDRPTWEKWHKRWNKSFLSECHTLRRTHVRYPQNGDEHCHMRMIPRQFAGPIAAE